MITPLVDLPTVRDRLRIDATDDQVDVERIIAEATDIVIGYLKIETPVWSIATVPERIRTAILLVCRAIYDGEDAVISQAVKDVLHRDRDPALA